MSELIASNWRLYAGAILPIVAFFLHDSMLGALPPVFRDEIGQEKQMIEKRNKNERGIREIKRTTH